MIRKPLPSMRGVRRAAILRARALMTKPREIVVVVPPATEPTKQMKPKRRVNV